MKKHECVINTDKRCPHKEISGKLCTYCKVPDDMTMTVAVPTENTGEQAYFKISFPKYNFNKVIETVCVLKKPEDVILFEEMGWWMVID